MSVLALAKKTLYGVKLSRTVVRKGTRCGAVSGAALPALREAYIRSLNVDEKLVFLGSNYKEYASLFVVDRSPEVRAKVAQLSTFYHDRLHEDAVADVRLSVALYGNGTYLEKLAQDADKFVRLAVARKTTKYFEDMLDDPYWLVRLEIAECYDKYHYYLHTDRSEDVRVCIAEHSDKYHGMYVYDESWLVRLEVARFSDKYHDILRNDDDSDVREAVQNWPLIHRVDALKKTFK